MNIQTRVSKYTFYRTLNGTLRCSEHSDGYFESEGSICNCTRHSNEPPRQFISKQVQTSITFFTEASHFDLKLGIYNNACYLSSFNKDSCNFNGYGNSINFTYNNGMYFSFDDNNSKPIPCFHITLFLGNEIDISTLMNGHSPSRVVDLSKIKPSDLWMHYCSWGREVIAFLEDSKEKEDLFLLYYYQDFLKKISLLYLDQDILVRDMESSILNCEGLDTFRLVKRLFDYMIWFQSSMRETELYNKAKSIIDPLYSN